MVGITVSHVPLLPAVAVAENENGEPALVTETVWEEGAGPPTDEENASVAGLNTAPVAVATVSVTGMESGAPAPFTVIVP